MQRRQTIPGHLKRYVKSRTAYDKAYTIYVRIAQFTDCGHSTTPPGQNDEVWDYRGKDAKGAYHLHIEFGDDGVLTLISRIPDEVTDSNGFAAQSVPVGEHHHMMAGMKM